MVTIYTGTLPYAGADANVFFTLYGTNGAALEHEIANAWSANFESGQLVLHMFIYLFICSSTNSNSQMIKRNKLKTHWMVH